MPKPFGVNVIGFISSDIGLGTAARASVRALTESGVAVATVDVQLPGGRSGKDLTWQHLNINDTAELPHPVNLVHMNPVHAAGVRAQFPQWFVNRFNVNAPFFELSELPMDWIALLHEYDLVVAATSFIAEAIRSQCSVAVRHYPVACERIAASPLSRAELGFADSDFLVALSFDLGSGVNRKNGMAAVRAFLRAFSPGDPARLVIKVNGAAVAPDVMQRLAALDPRRVRVITEYLPYERLFALFAACDAYLSLHRGEGLGLGLMESMSLGKPVVATGWSGNLDFMDERSAALVRYSLTPMVDRHEQFAPANFRRHPLWADPDEEHAARLLRGFYEDRPAARALGERGRARIDERASRFFGGEAAALLRACYEAWTREPPLCR